MSSSRATGSPGDGVTHDDDPQLRDRDEVGPTHIRTDEGGDARETEPEAEPADTPQPLGANHEERDKKPTSGTAAMSSPVVELGSRVSAR